MKPVKSEMRGLIALAVSVATSLLGVSTARAWPSDEEKKIYCKEQAHKRENNNISGGVQDSDMLE